MKTATVTKTAVTWMVIGGIASLAASMALGLPWADKNDINDSSQEALTSSKFCSNSTVVNIARGKDGKPLKISYINNSPVDNKDCKTVPLSSLVNYVPANNLSNGTAKWAGSMCRDGAGGDDSCAARACAKENKNAKVFSAGSDSTAIICENKSAYQVILNCHVEYSCY